MPSHGTFASELIVPVENVFSAPKHLNYLEASALPLAGLTAYRAVITKGQVRRGDRVLISGVGGGVAVFAFLELQRKLRLQRNKRRQCWFCHGSRRLQQRRRLPSWAV